MSTANFQAPPLRTPLLDKGTSSGLHRGWEQHFQGQTAKLNAPVSSVPPAKATSVGTPGQIAFDASFLYVCIAPSTWRRVAIGPW